MTDKDRVSPVAAQVILVTFFYVSGTCALIYEIAWTRMLTLVFGNTTFAVSTILASFMAGLAVGSFAYGRMIDRRGSPLRVYGLLELAIGCFAFLFPLLLPPLEWVNTSLSHTFASWPVLLRMVQVGIYFSVLVVPASLMGATFPVVSKYVVGRFEVLGSRISLLYAINTFGAVSGCLISGFLLIRTVGLRETTYVAAVANIAIALVALAVSTQTTEGRATQAPERPDTGVSSYSAAAARYAAAAFFVSGFCSLACEVLWTRMLVFFTGITTYAFSAMLATFLTGIGLGSLLMIRLVNRRWDLVKVLAAMQLAIGLFIYLSISIVRYRDWLPVPDELFRSELGFGFGMGVSWSSFLWQLFGNSVVIMAVPTLLMGASFPVAGRIASRSFSNVGSSIGGIYSINSIGSALGALVAGFALVPLFGMEKGIGVVAIAMLASATVLWWQAPTQRGWDRPAFSAITAVLTWVILEATVLGDGMLLRDRLVEDLQRRGTGKWVAEYYSEGLVGTVTVMHNETDDVRALYLDAFQAAGTPGTVNYNYMPLLGHLPMLLHDDPQQVLVIAFGTGTTAGAIGLHEFERLDIIEIEEDVLEAAPLFRKHNRGVLQDPRVHVTVSDGRNYLLRNSRRYDVISMEPLIPYFPAAVHLYTRDFYQLALERLKPGGLMCQWLPYHTQSLDDYKMLMVAFHEAFPYAYAWDIEGATALIGSATELALDPEAMRERLANPTLQKDLRSAKFSTLESLLNHFLHKDEAFARFASPAPAVTDNHPYVEFFAVPKKRYSAYQYDLLAALYQEKPDPLALLKQPAGPALVKSLERDALELRRHRRLMLQAVAERPGVLAEIEGMFAVQAVADTPLRVKQHARDWVEGGRAISGGVYEVIGESEYYYHVTGLGVAELTSAWIEKAKVRAEGTVRSARSSAPSTVTVLEDVSLLVQPGETGWVDAASVKRGDVVDVLSENDEYYLVRLRGDEKLRTGWVTKRSVEVVSGDDISPDPSLGPGVRP